jgi:hypothetical protein
MTDQYRARPQQWERIKQLAKEGWEMQSAIYELCSRIEALDAAQLEQAESHRFCTDAIVRRVEALEAAQQDKLDRLIALDAADPTPDPAMYLNTNRNNNADPQDNKHLSVTELRAWRPLDIETTYGSEAAADAAQILHAPMVVEGTFDHGGETYRFKAKPERESAMTELRAASAEARPVGGLVERVRRVIGDDAPCSHSNARAAIREVATWLDRFALHGSGEYAQAAKVLRQEVGQ